MLIVAVLLLGLAVGQAVLVIGFVVALRRQPPRLVDDAAAPRAAVILCLRGPDPFLGACLRGLLTQDYPDYEVRIVVDHPDDDAHKAVAAAIEEHHSPRVHVANLDAPRVSCSLKCSSLIQAVAALDERVEIVAQLDADVVPHRTWLRELATAVMQPGVGAATGNRWYMPERPTVGSLVRYTWNAAAIVQMYWYEIAWGGTLAVRTEVIRQADLLEHWGRAFCEDTMLRARLKPLGLRVAFVPSLMMINREQCTVSSFRRWVTRQLMTARLYHPAWPAVVGHGVISTLAPAAALAMLGRAVAHGEASAAWFLGGALAFYAVSLVGLLPPMESAVRRIAARRGERTRWVSPKGMLKCLAIMPLTQVVYPIALAMACLIRSTNWRDVDYRIGGPWNIQMLGYRPYAPQSSTEVANAESL